MRYGLLIFLFFLLAPRSLLSQEQDKSIQINETKTNSLPAEGKWKIVSITTAAGSTAIADNDFCISENLLAEYDRHQNAKFENVSLYNVNWSEKDGLFSTKLYRSPAGIFQIERFSDRNVAAYCYMQIENNSALLLISEEEIEGEPFESLTETHARMMTLYRVDVDSGTRASHLNRHATLVRRLFGNTPLHDAENRMIGGFLEEFDRSSPDAKK